MNRPDLYPDDFLQAPAPDWWEVEPNLPPAVRRAVRLNRIRAYEGTCWAPYIAGERIMLESDL